MSKTIKNNINLKQFVFLTLILFGALLFSRGVFAVSGSGSAKAQTSVAPGCYEVSYKTTPVIYNKVDCPAKGTYTSRTISQAKHGKTTTSNTAKAGYCYTRVVDIKELNAVQVWDAGAIPDDSSSKANAWITSCQVMTQTVAIGNAKLGSPPATPQGKSNPAKPSCFSQGVAAPKAAKCPSGVKLENGKCYYISYSYGKTGSLYDGTAVLGMNCTTNKISSEPVKVTKQPSKDNSGGIEDSCKGKNTDPSDGNCFDCTDPDNAGKDQCSFTKSIIVPIINVLSIAVGLIVVLSIIIAGIQYITSNGNQQQVETAKNRISNAILALVVFIFGFALLQWLIPGGVFH